MSDRDGWQDEFDRSAARPEGPEVRSCVVAADISALPELIRFVAEQGHRAALAASDRARLAIVVEELFVNSVRHGLPSAQPGIADAETAPAQVRLAISVPTAGGVWLDYRDRGVAFNPLRDGPAVPASSGELEKYQSGRLGGVGLWLLRQYAQETHYARLGGVNRLCFRIGNASHADQTKM